MGLAVDPDDDEAYEDMWWRTESVLGETRIDSTSRPVAKGESRLSGFDMFSAPNMANGHP